VSARAATAAHQSTRSSTVAGRSCWGHRGDGVYAGFLRMRGKHLRVAQAVVAHVRQHLQPAARDVPPALQAMHAFLGRHAHPFAGGTAHENTGHAVSRKQSGMIGSRLACRCREMR
jgi:hypothetical protein